MEAYSAAHTVLSARNSHGKAYTYIRQKVFPLLNYEYLSLCRLPIQGYQALCKTPFDDP